MDYRDFHVPNGKNTAHIRNEKIISQDTLGKLKKGMGIFNEGRDLDNILPNGKQAKK